MTVAEENQITEHFDPTFRLRFFGEVTTPRITKNGSGDQENWQVYFNPDQGGTICCCACSHGSYFKGHVRADGTTNLPEALDQAFRQLRKSK